MFDFFQATWLLEQLLPTTRSPGEGSQLEDERIRFRPHSGLGFPPSDVKAVELLRDEPPLARITATFMGLYGVDSPLPASFSDAIALETSESSPLRDFLDIFNHRLYSFFYRCWKKYRPALHFRAPGTDSHSRRNLCLAGIGTRGSHERIGVPPIRLAAFAGILSDRNRHAEGLENLLAHFLEGVVVRVIENVPRWVPVPRRLVLGADGGVGMKLGRTSTIGEKVFDITGKFRIALGPLTLGQFLAFLPGGAKARTLAHLVRLYVADDLEYDVLLSVKTEDIPGVRLGSGEATLGLATWVGRSNSECVSRLVAYH